MRHQWRIATAAIILLAGAGCASPAQDGQAVAQADRCINPTRIQKQEIISDQEIRFTLTGNEVWVNKLPRQCSGLKFQGGFTWEIRGMTVCSGEQIIYVQETGTPCQLGDFSRVAAATSAS